VAFKNVLHRLTAPVSELDEERLRQFCSAVPDVTRIADLEPRAEGTAVGEISSLRIVPRGAGLSLEATITDGTGSVVVVWTGRRRIPGVSPGRRLVVSGRGAPIGPGGRLLLYNPRYELLG
jgi:hypothetical protein